jgi:hypothetical protein
LIFFISKEKVKKSNEKKLFEVMHLKLFDNYNKEIKTTCERLKKFYGIAINMKEDDYKKLIDSQNHQENSDPVYLLIKTKKWTSIQKMVIKKVEIVYKDSNRQIKIKTADQIIEEAKKFFQE